MNQEPMGGQNFQQPINEPPVNPQPASPASPSQGGPAGEPGGWAPAAEPVPTPPPPPPPAGSNPFETTPPPIPPVSGPMQPMGEQSMEPAGQKSSLPLILILALLLLVGGLFLASWMGWISLGGIEKLWGGGKTETPTVEPITEPPATANVKDAERKEDLSNLKTALTKYYTATQSYPVAATIEKTNNPVALKVLIPDYITALPIDPSDPTYYYGYKSDGKTFELTAVLEDKTDLSGMMVGDIFLYRVTDNSAETPTGASGTSDNSDLTPDITQ